MSSSLKDKLDYLRTRALPPDVLRREQQLERRLEEVAPRIDHLVRAIGGVRHPMDLALASLCARKTMPSVEMVRRERMRVLAQQVEEMRPPTHDGFSTLTRPQALIQWSPPPRTRLDLK